MNHDHRTVQPALAPRRQSPPAPAPACAFVTPRVSRRAVVRAARFPDWTGASFYAGVLSDHRATRWTTHPRRHLASGQPVVGEAMPTQQELVTLIGRVASCQSAVGARRHQYRGTVTASDAAASQQVAAADQVAAGHPHAAAGSGALRRRELPAGKAAAGPAGRGALAGDRGAGAGGRRHPLDAAERQPGRSGAGGRQSVADGTGLPVDQDPARTGARLGPPATRAARSTRSG